MPAFLPIALLLFALFAFVQSHNGLGYKVNTPNKNWDYSYPYQVTKMGNQNWYYGSATWYDWMGNSGACGHPWAMVNSVDTAAVPPPRFQDLMTSGAKNVDGGACGQCYLVKCLDVPRYANVVFCKHKRAIRLYISDYDVPGDWNSGAWPNNHFDMQPKTFDKIAHKQAGIINIKFKRTSCKSRVAKWSLGHQSNPFWKDTILYYVPGVGSVVSVWAKPSNRDKWYQGKRLWGAHWSFLGGFVFDKNTKMLLVLAERKGSRMAMYLQRD